MSSAPETRSPLLRFLDAFLQEQNIKWMLGLGMLILLGSSLRLVSAHWTEYTPVWKYGILLTYTGAIFVAGRISNFRLGLRRTGTMLLALTVLLVPITFLALHWVRPETGFSLEDLFRQAGLLTLLVVNLVLSVRATHSVFVHFLHKPQPTFEGAYWMLCLAGAIVPGLPPSWSPFVLFCLWAVFTIGTVKVNRHVFWLAEEHRLPRIFGFFPVALLGGQFLTLFLLNRTHIDLSWCGVACVLASIPVVLTADAVAGVFQQRVGAWARPLPWSVLLPLLVGLGLCVGGIGLTLTDWPSPFALVPATALSAIVFAFTARRTERSGFVGLMLLCVFAAYQFSPLFFRSLAHALVQQGAAAVHEPKLPYAFYGLTYLPLLAVLSGLAGWLQRRGELLFSRRIQMWSVICPALLLVVAFGHTKAVFPSCAALAVLFAAQIFLFRNRVVVLLANLAFLGAAWGGPAFLEGVLSVEASTDARALFLTAAGWLLCFSGRWIDHWLGEETAARVQASEISQRLSLATAVLLASSCLFDSIIHPIVYPGLGLDLAVAGLLVLHTLRRIPSRALGHFTVAFATCSLLIQTRHLWSDFAVATAGILIVNWLVGCALQAWWPRTRVTMAFATPLRWVARQGLLAAATISILEFALRLLLNIPGLLSELDSAFWISRTAVIAWCYLAAQRERNRLLPVLGTGMLLGSAALAWRGIPGIEQGLDWILPVWGGCITFLMVVVREICAIGTHHHADSVLDLVVPDDVQGLTTVAYSNDCLPAGKRDLVFAFSWLNVLLPCLALWVSILALPLLGWLPRIATVIALGGLIAFSDWRRDIILRQVAAALCNWNVVLLLVQVLVPNCGNLLQLTGDAVARCVLPVAAACAMSGLFLDVFLGPPGQRRLAVLDFQRLLLRVATVGCLFYPIVDDWRGMDTSGAALATLSTAAITLGLLIRACQTREVSHVWWAELVGVATIGYLVQFGVIEFGSGLSIYLVLGAGLALHVAGKLCARREFTQIIAEPFFVTGFWLPLISVALAIGRFRLHPEGTWVGANSLALLFAAAFYFWKGLECRSKPLFVLSTLILNVALALLWGDLHWTDPQLFMIPMGVSVIALTELLRAEIPERMHNPLLYAGALIILVSPTFEILGGSWVHLFTLMVASVCVVLTAIGLRIRAVMYTGTAFLLADLVALVVRSSVDRPNLLWVAGIALGTGVVALGAYCESHREQLLARLRTVAAEMESWR